MDECGDWPRVTVHGRPLNRRKILMTAMLHLALTGFLGMLVTMAVVFPYHNRIGALPTTALVRIAMARFVGPASLLGWLGTGWLAYRLSSTGLLQAPEFSAFAHSLTAAGSVLAGLTWLHLYATGDRSLAQDSQTVSPTSLTLRQIALNRSDFSVKGDDYVDLRHGVTLVGIGDWLWSPPSRAFQDDGGFLSADHPELLCRLNLACMRPDVSSGAHALSYPRIRSQFVALVGQQALSEPRNVGTTTVDGEDTAVHVECDYQDELYGLSTRGLLSVLRCPDDDLANTKEYVLQYVCRRGSEKIIRDIVGSWRWLGTATA